jgi:N-acetylglucosamine-6-phosphate deacetylase
LDNALIEPFGLSECEGRVHNAGSPIPAGVRCRWSGGWALLGWASRAGTFIIEDDYDIDGHLARHLRRMRNLYAERVATLIEGAKQHLGGLLPISNVRAGFYTIGYLKRFWGSTCLRGYARPYLKSSPKVVLIIRPNIFSMENGFIGCIDRTFPDSESRLLITIKRLAAKMLVTSSGVLANPLVTMDGEHIVRIATRDEELVDQIDYDFPDATLTVGFLDIHFHGVSGQDVMNASPDGFREIARNLALAGVSKFLPTTVTASLDATLYALDRMATFIEAAPFAGTAQGTGIHIEGPFLSHVKRGMHPAEHLLTPSPELLNQLWEAARGQIRLMTIAPELPGALGTIAHAVGLGIRCSMGHSMATQAQAVAAVEAGVISATHTFNAMRAFDHREPGILGVVLDRADLYADLICDGYHVAPEAVRLWMMAKGPQRGILITDCLSAAGRPDGMYMTGEVVVHVEGDVCRTEAGVLAGSVISLDRAVANLCQITRAELPVAARLASSNPARMLGLPELLRPGAPADFNVYDAQGIRRQGFIRGSLIQ